MGGPTREATRHVTWIGVTLGQGASVHRHERTFRQRRRPRGGLSLLELIAVVTLVGVLSVVAIARLGPTVLGDIAAQSDARRLVLDLDQIRRRAIATGDSHHLSFNGTTGSYSGYTLYRNTSGGDVVVDSVREFPSQLRVSANASQMVFDFEGQAGANYRINLVGPKQGRRVDVIALTGAVRLSVTKLRVLPVGKIGKAVPISGLSLSK